LGTCEVAKRSKIKVFYRHAELAEFVVTECQRPSRGREDERVHLSGADCDDLFFTNRCDALSRRSIDLMPES
jgi:hypothetical protein